MSGGFYNSFRENDDHRTIEGIPLQGWVTANDDTKRVNPDGSVGPGGHQHVQVRIHVLHDDIEDTNLPWFAPAQLSAYSGAANIGNHGPIPQIGTKVWVSFNDKSQYHGVYGGGVATTTNQIPEFTGKGTPVKLPGNVDYNFASNYPSANGNIDGSGSITGNDEKTDTVIDMHVSGTGHAVDGKGNFSATINGGQTTSNSNASSLFPTGGQVIVFGNLTLFVSGNLTVSVNGNMTAAVHGDMETSVNGDLTVGVHGATVIASAGNLELSSQGDLSIQAGGNLKIDAGGTVAIDGGGASPAAPISVPVIVPPQPSPRPRPDPKVKSNDTNY